MLNNHIDILFLRASAENDDRPNRISRKFRVPQFRSLRKAQHRRTKKYVGVPSV